LPVLMKLAFRIYASPLFCNMSPDISVNTEICSSDIGKTHMDWPMFTEPDFFSFLHALTRTREGSFGRVKLRISHSIEFMRIPFD